METDSWLSAVTDIDRHSIATQTNRAGSMARRSIEARAYRPFMATSAGAARTASDSRE